MIWRSCSWRRAKEAATKADLDELQRMNEGMNHSYRAFIVYCYTPKALCNHVGGGGDPQPPPVCSIHLDDTTAATGQRRQCAHHTPDTGGEERET